jgi:protein-tyrosine kinase
MVSTRTSPEKTAFVAPGGTVNISLPALRAAGLLAPEEEEHQLAQQYRQIKRPLITRAVGRGAARLPNGHVIMVASALAGEGKTFTALNLALSMSIEKDIHVLLVDADVAKPLLSGLLGLGDAPGLLDVLRDSRLGVESVILRTNIPTLSVLPAGSHSQEATELLASARMEEVVRVIAKHDERRLALFDSPPLLLTTESPALAQVAGQVVMVVRAGVTSRQAVLAALTYVGAHPSVSLVLNQCRMSARAAYDYSHSDRRSEAARRQAVP